MAALTYTTLLRRTFFRKYLLVCVYGEPIRNNFFATPTEYNRI